MINKKLPEYSPEASNRILPDNVVRTWNWILPKGNSNVPDQVDPRFFNCRSGPYRSENLKQFYYEGQVLYVCPFCGNVYEIIINPEKKGQDPLHLWKGLFNQPFEWKYIKNPEFLDYTFIHEFGGLTYHPLLDAHCSGGRMDCLDLIARYFERNLAGRSFYGANIFNEKLERVNVSREDDALILSTGKYPGTFPDDEYCVYREDKDSLALEVSHSWEENAFGFTLDLNPEDFECYAGYQLIKFTFLGHDSECLDDRIRELDERRAGAEATETAESGKTPKAAEPAESGEASKSTEPAESDEDEGFAIERQIVRNPFGLDGFFLYEKKDKEIYLGPPRW